MAYSNNHSRYFIIVGVPKSATYLHDKLLTSVCR